jgi:hypothetical protein
MTEIRIGRMVDVSGPGMHANHTPDKAFLAPTVHELHAALGRFIGEGDGDLNVIISYAKSTDLGVRAFGRLALGIGRLSGEPKDHLAIVIRDEDVL